MVASQYNRHSITCEGKIINLYTSKISGLTCINVELDLPTVSGYFTLATECLNDTGSPHTLEHLIFLGSKQYPYKGVLDSLANRAFAQGTNAWTDTDHTAYTIETVGSEGFLLLLPIFVDHILYPTLTQSGCYTEVHHINGKGEDAGVVYSEMQGVENTGPNLMSLHAQRMIHDEKSGYRSETGGLLSEVRKLTVDEIRRYHATYYVPHNLVLVITGKVDENELMQTLTEVDDNIKSHGLSDKSQWRRPWVDSNPQFKLKKAVTEYFDFPEEDESMGEISINWPGPSCTNHTDICALDILGQYLAHSAISPLQAELVEIEEPLCTDIDFYVSDRLRSVISVSLSSVPVENLAVAEKKFFEVLAQISRTEIDSVRMHDLIDKEKLKVKNAVETDPHGAFSTPIITDFLYGNRDGSSLEQALDDTKHLDHVKTWTSAEWQDFIKKWLLNNPYISMLGRPSEAMAKKIQSDEEARIAAQAQALGETGLKDLEARLSQAQIANDVPVPDEMIVNFPVPSVEKINYIRPETACIGFARIENRVQKIIDKDAYELPLSIQYDNVSSEFASISIYLTTSSISKDLKPYLSTYLHSFFLNPISRQGVEIDYEDVVEELEKETISYSASFGAGGGFNELIKIKVKVEAKLYSKGITWLSELLYDAVLDAERISVAISKIQNDLPSYKRDGDTVATSVLGVLELDANKSAARAANLLDQTKFLDTLEKQLDDDEDAVIEKFEQLRSQLATFENIRIHVTADVAKLDRPVSSWSTFGPSQTKRSRPRGASMSLSKIDLTQDVLTDYARKPNGKCQVVTIPTDSCYAQHFAQGLSNFNDPDLPALMVMTSYLNAMEGLLWKYIRGSGLAYGADLKIDPEAGLVYFSIYRSPDSFAAWAKAKEIMQDLASGKIEISKVMLEGAKSAIVFDFVSRESTPYAAAHQSFVNQILKGQSSEYRRDLLKEVAKIDITSMMAVLQKYLIRLFDNQTSNCVVVSGTAKSTQLEKDFSEAGFDVSASTLEAFEESIAQH